ncbi:hypothetical protein OG871_40605 (plasmid) [Kitasatospora sp. NBC_00374]|uniref:DUF6573 family protein n=1 Tax=Kitasatospora sp. NBC_00374 TaxID=2975964 RepID=UPI002F911E5C
MTSETTIDSMIALFGEPIHTYSRAEAIADGVLVQVPAEAQRRAGLRWPVAVTGTVHGRCVAWGEDEVMEAGRLNELLWTAHTAIAAAARRGDGGALAVPFRFAFHKVESPGIQREVRLTIAAGPGDDGEPVMTIMFPDED